MLHRKKSSLEAAAKNEIKLLDFHKVSLPCIDGSSLNYDLNDIDAVSMEILLKYHPAYIEENVPLTIVGDGNCLYRAVSRKMTGSELYHKVLRLEAALELIIFREKYDPSSKNKLPFVSDSRIITSNVDKLIQDAVKLGSYSELAHMYAISSSLSRPIRSYYPPQLHPELTSEPFTRTVVGRDVKLSNTVLCIMWTSTRVNSNVNRFTPNHFVPIVNKFKMPVSTPIVVEDIPGQYDDLSNELGSKEIHSLNCSDNSNAIDQSEIVEDNQDLDDVTNSESNNDSVVECKEKDFNVSTEYDGNSDQDSRNNDNDENSTDKSGLKGSLIPNCFLETSKVVNLLVNSNNCFEYIPVGKKENVFFVINNEQNLLKRKGKAKSSFSDDCGVWLAQSSASPSSYYLLQENGDLRKIYFYKKQFCSVSRCKVNGKVQPVYTPLDPQPDPSKVVNIRRYYAKSKKDTSYQKRVTWLGDGGLQSNYAIIEYIGQFPGLAPHGNSKNSESEYLRTPDHVMDEAGDLLCQKKT